jgi:hypothetical protein
MGYESTATNDPTADIGSEDDSSKEGRDAGYHNRLTWKTWTWSFPLKSGPRRRARRWQCSKEGNNGQQHCSSNQSHRLNFMRSFSDVALCSWSSSIPSCHPWPLHRLHDHANRKKHSKAYVGQPALAYCASAALAAQVTPHRSSFTLQVKLILNGLKRFFITGNLNW